jgi:tetratricopeptide (TPR) repeat protein
LPAALCALLMAWRAVPAQPVLPLKPALTRGEAPGCEDATPMAALAGGARNPNEARRQFQLAQDAALQGDQRIARDALRRAQQLDPLDDRVAWELARIDEELGDTVTARHGYCRVLALRSSTRPREEVVARVARLLPASFARETRRLDERFRAGVSLASRNQWSGAEAAFDEVVRALPRSSDALFNRAVARTMIGRRAEAVRDFERYLALAPDAPDRVAVARSFASLRRPVYAGDEALARGLLPGGGQFYTGRRAAGVLVLATVAAAGAAAFMTESRTRTVQYVDPNGVPVPYTERYRARPYLVPAIAGAVVVTGAAALEAMWYARRSARIAPSVSMGPGGAAVAVAVRF